MLGIPVLLSVALLILTVLLRWKLKDEEPMKAEEFQSLPMPAMASRVTSMPEVEAFGFDGYRSTVVPGRHQCAVCVSNTYTRCSRCKAVRYCSSKCQIAHWRQGHKYECHPQVPSVFDRENSSGNVETMEQRETNGNYSAERLSMTNEKGTDNPMHSDLSDSHIVIPRLSTLSIGSLDDTVEPNPSGELKGPVLDSDTPNMVQKEDISSTLDINTPMKSQFTGFENSAKNKYKEKLRQRDRTKARASSSDLSSGFGKDHCSEDVVSGDLHRPTSKEVPDVDLLLVDRQKHSQAFKYGEETLLTSKHSGSSFLPAKGDSGFSPLPPSGFRSSLQRVVRHLKTSHQKKPPLRISVLETYGKHSFKYDTFMRLYSSNEVELKPFGLINCGNSCYANAVLQCLAYTRPLTLYLLEGRHSKECWKEEWCFICEFEHLILKAREGYTPLSLVRILTNISHLGHGREEDAHEFLRYAVDTMQSVCIEQAGIAGPVAEEITLIGMTFGGYLHSKIKCIKCRNKSEKYERMMDLTVEIDGDIRTLEQALKRFTASEVLEGHNKYHCNRCKSYEKAKKKLTVFQAPNILTIVLKRFQASNFRKLNKPVQFPVFLNMTPYMSGLGDRFPQYSLYAVVVHSNAMNAALSGHYVCYVKNYHGKWFKIDDSEVLSVDVERVLSEEAYMLLYARHSPRHPASTSNAHDGNLCETNVEAIPRHSYGKSAVPKTRQYSPDVSADPLVMQHQPSRNGHVKNPSYLEEWVTHSVESIPLMDSSSEVSSLFSCSEEGTCSTPSTKDSASVEDFSDFIFGRRRGC